MMMRSALTTGSPAARRSPRVPASAVAASPAHVHGGTAGDGVDQLRRSLACAIFARLRDAGVRVAVLNGLDSSSGAIGRDLDVLIHRRDLPAIIRIGHGAAADAGWEWSSSRWLGMWLPRGLCQLVAQRTHEGRIINLAFDLIASDGLAAGVVPTYTVELLGTAPEWIEGIPFSRDGHYLKTGLVNVLAGLEKGFSTVERHPEIPPAARRSIATSLGSPFLMHYESVIRDGSLRHEWRALRKRAQRAVLFRNPVAAARNAACSALRRLVGSRLHPVTTVAVVGPDGVGKSSAIAACRELLSGAFVDVRCRHWRPGVLPPLGAFARGRATAVIPPDGVPPRRHAGRFALARRVYYAADYLIGHWVQDRRSSSSEIPLNLYDRCALDMHVDPLRFGLPASRSNLLPQLLGRKPDRVIVLRDSPDRIAGRKRELSAEEIRRQNAEWEALYRQGHVQQFIDVNGRSADEVGAEIAAAILGLLAGTRPGRAGAAICGVAP